MAAGVRFTARGRLRARLNSLTRVKGETPDPIVRRWLKIGGGALFGLAVAVLIGRFTGQTWLVTLVPNASPMAFPTVVALLLGGAALFTHGREQPRPARLLATLLVLFGAGTLALYALAEPLGFQRFVYDPLRPVISQGVGFDGRMSPGVALATLLLGAGHLLLAARRLRPVLAATVVALLLAISLLAAISYLTDLRLAVRWWRYTAMAVHTAGGFLAAAAVLFFWLMRRMAGAEKIATRTLPFFVGAGTVVLVLGAVVLVSNEQRLAATRAVTRTIEVEGAIDRFISSVARLESSTRAFALTGDERYLERIQVHRASTTATADALVRLTAGDPPQHARALALRPLIERKFAVNDEQVQARRVGGTEAAARTLTSEAPELMAGLRASTDGLEAEERRVAARLRSEAAVNETRLRWVLLLGGIMTIVLVSTATSLVQRAQADLQGANEQLEQRVRARTAELEASSAQLRENEARLRFMADTMPQLVWTARIDGTVESVNQGYRVYLGEKTEAGAIAALADVVHPDDQAETSREWLAMREERRSAGGELRLKRADGVYRWHLWRAHPEQDATGAIVRWVGTSTDIHDQKMAEERLETRVAERTADLGASEQRFRHAFHFAGTGMAIVALDGRWTRVNRSVCEILGYGETELLDKTFQEITHPEDLAADLANVQALLAGTLRYYQMEKRYFHRDGHIVWGRLTVSLVSDNDGRPVHFVSQIEDITEHKRLEENLARARDQALEGSRLKSEFLAMMSHEIRTPMNGVVGMTALLRDTTLTPAQSEFVRTIETSAESLLTIINDILDYSKIEAGRIELEVVPFDLRQCILDALDLFTARALEKKIELIYSIGADVPTHVLGDVTRLRQILVNLLGNALKFTAKGQVSVTTVLAPEPGDGARQRLKFTITDTGIGIPADRMDRLFKSFSQVDASTTRRFGGTGLGLAISQRLAELMGGTIRAESRGGEGSSFHFTVLVEPQTQSLPEAGAPLPRPVHDATLGRRCPLRLLIAEDNPVNQRVANLLLQRLGYRATTVANGLEALAALEMADYDVVLMDVEMPELDGCEATRRIRAVGTSSGRPWIIALTAGAMAGDRERALDSGMNDFLTKPVRTEALSAALAKAHAAVAGNAAPRADELPEGGAA